MAINTVVAALRGGCNVNYEAADTIEELQKTIDLHNNVMGRIAISLFGEQNNRTDEECVTKVAEVVRERDRLRQHLHDEHQRHIWTMDERDALAAQCYAECAAICRKAEDWSDGSLGWNRACKRMAIAIEHALSGDKP